MWLVTEVVVVFWIHGKFKLKIDRSDEGLTLETSALSLVTVANLKHRDRNTG